MESNAAGLVLRPALKTGFSEKGWGSTPLLSANIWMLWNNGVLAGCNPVVLGRVGSIPTTSTKFMEVWLSGLRHLSRKQWAPQGARGFESYYFRQLTWQSPLRKYVIVLF